MEIIVNPSRESWAALCRRAENDDSVIEGRVRAILERVRAGGDAALADITREVEGRDVLIVEDVVDSGLSMRHMLDAALAQHPRSVRICTLFFKPKAFRGDYRVDYVGREIGNEFIVGYGLDYDEHGRGLKDVWVVRG